MFLSGMKEEEKEKEDAIEGFGMDPGGGDIATRRRAAPCFTTDIDALFIFRQYIPVIIGL